ncbi:MAG TPA: divergent polysaccharide deacetylase family protein [Smithella sp.]|nr:divergent polysaccharide deacetylase family protein [Smithella sp.]MDM7986578.1 divergent polysaccharide deacetylase family protein [Smithella sp.]HNY49149.1 divergent polysaccharide deacetylase family protein [Smithella sp.]HOG90025.1 divergent polysaccharide deacetylase family protein [Smithella sp.]HOU49595.1 divergent polysaccharide deacetylase family protein [Smithella sp.]
MTLLRKLFTATLILFIVLTVAGIVYVLFQEEPSAIKETKKFIKQTARETVKPKDKSKKSASVKAAPLREVAIIIDDIGYDLDAVRELLKIKADLTFAIVPFQRHSREAAELFHKAKKETLLHLPMEPVSYPDEKPGEGALFTDMSDEEIALQLRKNFTAVPHVSGVNNHMGSKFMMDEKKLSVVFRELKKRNMFFVDSRTSADTKTAAANGNAGLKIGERKVFIDNHRDYNKIYANLMNVADGADISAEIIIGHPYPETVRALKDATKIMRQKGVSIVPVSRLVNKMKYHPS